MWTIRRQLADSERAFADVLNLIPEPVVVTDVEQGRFLFVNQRWESISGRTLAEVRGRTSRELGYWEDRSAREELRGRLIEEKQLHGYSVQLTSKDGARKEYEVSARLTEMNRVPAMLYIFRDVTQERNAFKSLAERELALLQSNDQLEAQLREISILRDRLREQAIRDSLTGLHNRRYFDEVLPRELEQARRDGGRVSLVMMDLDHFKSINDTYGHAAGDRVIVALSRVLEADVRGGDLLCRYGGEEFIVALRGATPDEAVTRVEQWRRMFEAQTIDLGSVSLQVTLSAGVATFPTTAVDAESLVANADHALYRAKEAGRNRVCAFAAA